MNRVKKLIIILAMLFVFIPLQAVNADTMEEYLNNLVGPKKQYNTEFSSVYLRNNAEEESISPASGELSLAQTDYFLTGRNGLDLEIKRIYKSGISNVQEMKVKYVNGAWVDYVFSDETTSTFFEDRYDLGIGMRFSFPMIEIRKNEDQSNYKFLHTESGDTYRLIEVNVFKDLSPIIDTDSTVDSSTRILKQLVAGELNGKKVYFIEGQTVIDAIVIESDEFSNGQADGVSKYKMVDKAGKRTYFAEDGRVLGIVDRYGNTIKFEYAIRKYTINKTSREKKLISKITDTVGRVVTIDYNEDYTFRVKPINSTSYSQEESWKESQNPNTTYSGDLEGKFQVVVNLPDGNKLKYDKSAVLVSNDTRQVIRTRLQRVYDVDNLVKYHYWYDQQDLGFTYFNGKTYSAFNRYENIAQINYFKENKLVKYTYNTYTRRLGDKGSMQYRKIFEKQEIAKTGYDAAKINFPERYTGNIVSKISYSYTNAPDGYGFTGYMEENHDYLKDTYRFYSEETNVRGAKVKYTFNGLYELVTQEQYGNNHKEVITIEHDEMKLPKKTERLVYNVTNGQAVGEPVKKIENSRYDGFGNLTNYTGPLAPRDANGYPSPDSKYMVVYSYDINRFHVPSTKTWNKDMDTQCQISYTVDDKGNTIKENRLHVDEGSLEPIIIDYEYDDFGNMIRKSKNSPDNTYTTYYEYGIDKDGTDHKGAYLTREYNVLDGSQISKYYVYDFLTGDVTAEIDQNANRTNYEYDMLHRLIQTTYPNGGTWIYNYADTWNQNRKREITDSNEVVSSYSYDIMGYLVDYRVFDKGQWHLKNKYEYDSDGNKIKEIDANGNSIRFEYDSANLLTEKSYWEKDAVEKEAMILKYTMVNDGTGTFRMITATDEEGYITKLHYDVANRLAAVETTPDREVFYKSTYTYDFEGNKTSYTDARNNTTRYIFDDSNRLVSQIDPLNNETKYTYNNNDKLIKKEEPGNKVTEYAFDTLGRVTIEKVHDAGESSYAYTRYDYDNAGNKTRLRKGTFQNGVDNNSSDISYKYNNMNKVSDEYVKIDATRTSHINNNYDKMGNKIQTTEFINESENRFIRRNYEHDFDGRTIREEEFIQDSGDVRRGYSETKYTYDYTGNMLTKEELDGSRYNVSNYAYDHRNRQIRKEEPYKLDGAKKTTKLMYDRKGNLISETFIKQGMQCTKTYEYDGSGNLIRVTDELGNTTRYVYDSNDNKIKEIDPRYYTTAAEKSNPELLNTAPRMEYEYDAMNRLARTTVKDADTSFVLSYSEYDGRGNTIKLVSGEGYNNTNPTESIGGLYEYDAMDRTIKYTSAETEKYNRENAQSKHTTKYTYDALGNKLSEEDAYGNVTYYNYYQNGLLKEKVYSDAVRESYQYDLTGKVEVISSDRKGNITKQYNNIFGKPYRIEYPDGTSELTDYTTTGQVNVSIDRKGNNVYYQYDSAQNEIAEMKYIKSDGQYEYYRLIEKTYDEAGNILTEETFTYNKPLIAGIAEVKQSAGDKVIYTYDKASRLIKLYGPNGRDSINEYDLKGNLSALKQKVSEGYYDVTRYKYDVLSRLIEEAMLVESSAIDTSYLAQAAYDQELKSRVKSKTSYTYYKDGSLKSKTDAKGNTTRYINDLDMRTKQVIDPLEYKTTYFYDLCGNLVEETDAKNTSTIYNYDKLNRMIRKITPAAGGGTATTRYIYDVIGNLIKQIEPNNYNVVMDTEELAVSMPGMSYEYDKMNRLVITRSPYGAGIKYTKYDAAGNVVKEVDGLRYNGGIEASKGTGYSYDGLNRMISSVDALGYATEYVYDILDNTLSIKDARNNTAAYVYNPDGTVSREIFADGGTVQYEYDKLGRMTKKVDQNGSETKYTYNAFGQQNMIVDAYGSVQEFKYDLSGNLTLHVDEIGSITKQKYDGNNRLAEKKISTDAISSGNYHYLIERYTYDETGNVLSKVVTGTKEPLSKRIANYTYYPNGLVDTITQSSGKLTKNSYDKNGNIVKVESLRDNEKYDITRYEYDNQDRLIKTIQLIETERLYKAEELDNIENLRDSEYTDSVQIITGYEYDLLGNKTKVISTEAYGYLESDEENRAAYTTVYSYDLLNRPEKIIRQHNGEEVFTQFWYDEVGNRIQERNEKGYLTIQTYNNMNRVETLTDALGKTYEYDYDLLGNKKKYTNPKGDTITYIYDKLNRTETVIDPYDKVINKKVYDAKGNVIKEIDAKGYISGETDEERYGTIYQYNLIGKVVKVIDPEVAERGDASKFTGKYDYNQYGELIKLTDALGNSTQYEYDNAGKLVKVTDALGVAVKYTYDKAGNKLSVTDGRGKITQYEYGSFGMMVSYTDPDKQRITYAYGLNFKSASIKDRNGNETVYSYNNKGLLTDKRVIETGDFVSYAYDTLGNKETMTDATGTSTYGYNENNWLISIEKDGEAQVAYGHDDIGNIISVTDKLDNITEYTYDKSSRMKTVSFDDRTTAYEYDENGNRKNISYDGEVEEAYTYDKNNRLLELVNRKSFGEELSSYSYTYDLAGRQTSKTDSYGTTSYNYDKVGRILKVEAPGKTTGYTYDNAGNRISQDETYTSEQVIPAIDGTGIGEIKYIVKRSEYVYSNSNRLLKLVEKMKDIAGKELLQKTTTFGYDSNGNELRRSVEYLSLFSRENPKAYEAAVYSEDSTEPIHAVVDQTVSKYDGFNRMIRSEIIKAKTRTVVEYAYNGDGLRVEKTVKKSDKGYAAEVTGYLYDRQHVILETRGNEDIRYIRGINYIGRIDNTDKHSYFLFNGHGDVVQTVSEAGEIENQYDYDIFGNPTLTVEDYLNCIRYAGEFYDVETGLYYLRARYYDPYIGRFVSEDSYWGEDNNPLSLNLYTYAYNDPLKYIDPTGHKPAEGVSTTSTQNKDKKGKSDSSELRKEQERRRKEEEAKKRRLEELKRQEEARKKQEEQRKKQEEQRKKEEEEAKKKAEAAKRIADQVAKSQAAAKKSKEQQLAKFEEGQAPKQVPKPEPKPGLKQEPKPGPKQVPQQDPKQDLAQEKQAKRQQEPNQANTGTGSEDVKNSTTTAPENKAEAITTAGGSVQKAAPTGNSFMESKTDAYGADSKGTGENKGDGTLIGPMPKIDDVMQAAIEDAKLRIDAVMGKSVGGSSINSSSIGAIYTKTLNLEIEALGNRQQTLDYIDLYMSYYKADGKGLQKIALGGLDWKYNPEPGLDDTIKFRSDKVNALKEVVDMAYENNFNYLVVSKSARKEFVNELNQLEGFLNEHDFPIYDSSSENNKYKNTMVDYVKNIRSMNENYDHYFNDFIYLKDSIFGKYK